MTDEKKDATHKLNSEWHHLKGQGQVKVGDTSEGKITEAIGESYRVRKSRNM